MDTQEAEKEFEVQWAALQARRERQGYRPLTDYDKKIAEWGWYSAFKTMQKNTQSL